MKLLRVALPLFCLGAAHAQTMDRAALMRDHRGGTLKLAATRAQGTIDPQINYTSQYNQVFAIVTDGLVTFRKSVGPRSLEVVPDLADAMPDVRDGGTTYVFHLRPGIKFSDGRTVGVADVVASFRRLFKVSSPNAASWYNIIVGGDACVAHPATCTLEGGVIGDPATNTITIHTTRPSGEFLYQLAMPFAAILPADTQPTDLGVQPPITTGPYTITAYNPIHAMILKRNPYFHEWSVDAQPDGYPDEINYRYGLENEAEVTAVFNGQIDWMFDFKPLDRVIDIGTNHPSLAHINQMLGYYYLPMNVNLPPFNNADARRAVAMAINRRAVLNLFGGPAMGTPLCQLLPNGIPGYVEYCPYTKNPGKTWQHPDIETARELVKKSGTAGMKVTLITSDIDVEHATGLYLQSVLADIGYDARLQSISNNIAFTYMQNSNNRMQIGLTNWYQDYPAASDFLYIMNACSSFHPGSDASVNMSGFCNPAIDAAMEKAIAQAVTDPSGAARSWQDINRTLTDLAPETTLFQINELNIVSPRVGNYTYSSLYHLLFSQVWVK